MSTITQGLHYTNGFYADDCSSNYYVCTNGNKVRYQCPAKLIFSDAKEACEGAVALRRCAPKVVVTSKNVCITHIDCLFGRPCSRFFLISMSKTETAKNQVLFQDVSRGPTMTGVEPQH
uniref:Chitin-binding type-2 domain-containing protein n=1 Tax=Panagrellus redivivus TaxID=6233 RepID=A0A7E4VMV9_PANRE